MTDNNKISLKEGSEEFNYIKLEWKKRSKECSIEDLPGFLKELTESYNYDYGTICHAMAMAAVSSIRAMDKTPQGGITGFQAGAIMWEFVREFNHSGNKTGLMMVDYDNFLYPQYENRYDKVISKSVWDNIQDEAKKKIEKADADCEKYIIDTMQYQSDLAEFILKYPDYEDNKLKYERIGMGTFEQWSEQEVKEKSGFEFAPTKPYCFVDKTSPVYAHWVSIVNGIIPFGYSIRE